MYGIKVFMFRGNSIKMDAYSVGAWEDINNCGLIVTVRVGRLDESVKI